MKINIIAAIAKNGAIGKAGQIPWRFPEDMKHFKETTNGHAVAMGRRTWESIGRCLPNRTNIVVASTGQYSEPGLVVALSLDEAIDRAAEKGHEQLFIIGGARLYDAALSLADRLYITEVDLRPEADVFWSPVYDDFAKFTEVERRPGTTPELTFVTWDRR